MALRKKSFISPRFYLICLFLATFSAITVRAYYRAAQFAQNSSLRSAADAKALATDNPIRPYVATFEERVSNPARQLAFVSARLLEGVREDGAKVKKGEYFSPTGHMFTERILYLPNDVVVDITDDTKTVVAEHKAGWNPKSVGRLDPQSDCERDFRGQQTFTPSGPEDLILGHRAVRLTRVKEDATAHWTQWYLPEMGCLLGKQLVGFLDKSGAITDGSERVMMSLSATAPSPELYQIPKDYDQASPSDAIKRRAILLKNPLPPNELALLQSLDFHYYSNRVDVSKLR